MAEIFGRAIPQTTMKSITDAVARLMEKESTTVDQDVYTIVANFAKLGGGPLP